MKVFLVVVIVLGTCASAAAATTLYLPRQFEPAEMGTVGVALMNPSLSTARLTYNLRSAQGSVIMSSSGSLEGKSQRAQTIDQIFPGVASAGTLTVDVDVD